MRNHKILIEKKKKRKRIKLKNTDDAEYILKRKYTWFDFLSPKKKISMLVPSLINVYDLCKRISDINCLNGFPQIIKIFFQVKVMRFCDIPVETVILFFMLLAEN